MLTTDNPPTVPPRPYSCLVADDHPAMVAAVCAVLERHGVSIAGRASTGPETIAILEQRQPEIALVDLRMPGISGTEVAREAARLSPSTRVILYTAHGERSLLVDALDAGARGFVLKDAPLAELVRAVDMVAAGGIYIDPVLAGAVAADKEHRRPELTRRERDVLRLLAEGHTNAAIGKQLFISPETVRTHIAKLSAKLGAANRTHAVAKGLRASLIA